MRLSCPPSSSPSSLLKNFPNAPQLQIQPQQQYKCSISSSMQVWREHTQRLSQLYHRSKFRNQRLLQLAMNLSCNVKFLKQYCTTLERELDQRGFYSKKEYDALSRRQTAATIFQSYDDSCSELTSLSSSEGLQDELTRLQTRNLNLQIQNKQLLSQVKENVFIKVNQSVQVALIDEERIRRDWTECEQKIARLSKEVHDLRRANGELERDRIRSTSFSCIEGRQNVFHNIHCLISQYRQKLQELNRQKKDIQKRYVSLRERISLVQTGKQLKIMQILAQKIDLLQKFAEKQQAQIERTIDLYQSQLAKIQRKSKLQHEYFQNQKISLQSQNLQLCMDLQRTLNRNDSVNLQLLQQKNKTQILRREISNMAHGVALLQAKEITYKCQKLKIDSGIVKFYGQDFLLAQRLLDSQIKLSCHSAGYQPHNQNSNTSNYEYQYSQMEEHSPFMRKVSIGYPNPHRMLRTIQKQDKASQQSFKIVNHYGQVMVAEYNRNNLPEKFQHSNSNHRVWDSAVEYKKKFVERKPDSSFKR